MANMHSGAHHLYQASFVELEPLQQDTVLKSIHDAQPPAAHDIWQRMPVHRYWLLLMQDVVDAYYAHPYAWDEIGFGGPAYPRGFCIQGCKAAPSLSACQLRYRECKEEISRARK